MVSTWRNWGWKPIQNSHADKAEHTQKQKRGRTAAPFIVIKQGYEFN